MIVTDEFKKYVLKNVPTKVLLREFKTVRDTIQLNRDNIILKEQKSFPTEVLKLLNR